MTYVLLDFAANLLAIGEVVGHWSVEGLVVGLHERGHSCTTGASNQGSNVGRINIALRQGMTVKLQNINDPLTKRELNL